MKKFMKLSMCGLAAAMLMVGCTKEVPSEYGTITLGEYKGVEVLAQVVEVTDEEVEMSIEEALASNPSFEEITDRAAQNGDTVNVDYVGKKDDIAFEGGTAAGYDLVLGSNSFIDGFEAGLVGVKTGDKLNLDLTFPAEYQSEDLAGAAVVFEVTVNSIKLEKEAVLDDAFVQSISEYKTVDEFRQGTKDGILKQKQQQVDSQKMYEALQSIMANSEITCKEEAIEKQYNQQLDYYNSMMDSYGMKLEDYVSMFGMDLETFQGQLRTEAEDVVKQELVIEAVAKKERMKIKAEDRDMIAAEMGTDTATLVTQYGQELVDQDAMRYKVLTFLIKNAKEVDELTETTAAAGETTAAAGETTVAAGETTVAAETTAAATTVAETTAAAAETTVAETTVAETTVAETTTAAETTAAK